ncbi:MAG: hypothetical protein GWP06_14510 [Actinobacteria bacterium]|nr:hypothetical protein [Actinomycetota bacterium]
MSKAKVGFLALCAPVHVELTDEMGRSFPCTGWAEMAARSLEECPDVEVVRFPDKPIIAGDVTGPQMPNFDRDTLINGRQRSFEAFETLRKAGVDCVVLFFTTWMWVGHYMQAIKNCGIPTILWGVPRGEACNTVGLHGMHGTMNAIGMKHGFVYGMPGEKETTDQVLDYAKAFYAVKKLSTAKYGKFGSKCMDMLPSIADDVEWLRRFGVEIEHMDEGYLMREASAAKDADIKKAYNLLDKYVANKPDFDIVKKDLSVFVALKKIKEEHDLDFIGVKCVFEMGEHYIAPCLTQALLGAEGVASSCCSDDNGILTAYIMNMLGGKSVFQADVNRVDMKNNEMVMVPCGSAPLDMAASPKHINLPPRPELESGTGGVCIDLQIKPGLATMARISRSVNDYFCHIATGKVHEADRELHKQCGFPSIVHGFVKMDGDMEKFMRNCHSQYLYFTFADIVKRMKIVADWFGLKVLED